MNLLEGITVIDFTRLLPGPVTTHMLAQMGATVIKIESPKRRDYVRDSMTQVEGASVLFHQLNHNKQQLSIDYNTPEGLSEVMALIKTADVLVEQFRPGVMSIWELGYEQVKKVNPGIVYASISGYGQYGALSAEAGHDANYLSYSGLLGLCKEANGKPVIPGAQIADVCGAYSGLNAIQAALIKRFKTKVGCHLDIALCDAVSPLISLPYGLQSSGLDHKKFNLFNGVNAANYTVYQCSDDQWLVVAALEMKFWNTLCELVGKPEWKRNNVLELTVDSFPRNEVVELFKSKPRKDWLELFAEHDTCVSPVLELEALEEHPYHLSRGTFEDFKTKGGTSLKTIALPFRVME